MILLVFSVSSTRGQSVDPAAGKVLSFPSRLIARLQSRTATLDVRLTRQTESYLDAMQRREQRLQQKLSGVDPAAAQRLFAGNAERYAALMRKIGADSGAAGQRYSGVYLPYLDSLQGAMRYLGRDAEIKAYEVKLMDADEVRAYVQQRKQLIGQYIAQHAGLEGLLANAYAGMNKEVYYYSQQLREYKEIWTNPDRLEQKALALLNRLPAFQTFMKTNSLLGGLFNVPGGYGTPQGLSGLQTKEQVAELVQGKVGTGASATGAAGGADGAAALQSNLQNAETQLDNYKSKLSSLGAGNGDMDMPDFKPNNQKTKTFWKRLEYGADFQTTRNNYYFPMVTDFGLSLGYKLGHNNVIGLGASYKLGWGNGIQHIAFTSEGVGLRSFLQIGIKGSFSATGGFEYNYTTPFTSFQQLKQIQYWTKSGLIGFTKTVSLKSSVFRKTSVSLLWDFLSYQQTPQTQPLLFRIGYAF